MADDNSGDNIAVQTAPTNSHGGIMDVQPPKTVPTTEFTPSDSVTIPVTETESEASVAEPTSAPVFEQSPVEPPPEQAPEAPAEVPVSEETPPTDPAPITENSDSPPVSESTADTSAPGADNPMAIDHTQQPVAHKKSGAPMAAIIVAIVIAITLAALTVFAYMKSKSDTKITSKSAPTAAAALTAADVDQAGQEMDATLQKADDTKDFANELNDASLGL